MAPGIIKLLILSFANSGNHPSGMETLTAPFMAADMPLVPDASRVSRGIFNHTSAPIFSSFESFISYPVRMEQLVYVLQIFDDPVKYCNSCIIHRVRLSRPDDLDRPVHIGNQLLKTIHIVKQEFRSFITTKAFGKHDRQNIFVIDLAALVGNFFK